MTGSILIGLGGKNGILSDSSLKVFISMCKSPWLTLGGNMKVSNN